ncbi:MAG: hypothetical protein R6U46_04275 [Marinilabilia sp.]
MRQIVNYLVILENQIRLKKQINEPLKKLDKSDKDYNKKTLEICHVIKFLSLLNSGYQISEVREQPDFIIKTLDNHIAGLEHEILVDSNHKKIEGTFADIVKSAEGIFRERHPKTKLLANIYVNTHKKISKKDKPIHVKTLLSIIEDSVFHNQFSENDLVHNISWHKHSGLNFSCNPGGWCQQSLQHDTVKEYIHKKEIKRLDYIKNTGIEEQWLLIVIGSLNQSSYEIDSRFDKNFSADSGFNRIFLMEDFNARLFEL